MTFLIQQTLLYAVPLMIVALAGVFAERSGIINLALEGIMIFGAFIGVWFIRIMQGTAWVQGMKAANDWVALQGLEVLAMLDIVGQNLTGFTAYNEYITDVIISVIVYLSAFSLVIQTMLPRFRKANRPNANAEPAPAAEVKKEEGGEKA